LDDQNLETTEKARKKSQTHALAMKNDNLAFLYSSSFYARTCGAQDSQLSAAPNALATCRI
jgi:hypothetical protein